MTDPVPSRWVFPDPLEADDDIVAVGADLEPGTLLSAYRQGIFPMPLSDDDDDELVVAGAARHAPPRPAAGHQVDAPVGAAVHG